MDDKIYLETAKKTTVINPGIDLDIFYPHQVKKDPKTKIILCLGRKGKIRGLPDLIRAVEIIYQKRKNMKLIIVGRSKMKISSNIPYEQRQATDDELAQLYSSCDVFVLPSWIEGCPAPPLEAMACGAPVVVTDCLGVREYAKDGVNSLVVPPKCPDLLADAILRILNDEDLVRQIRQKEVETARKFTYEKAISKFEEACLKLLGKNSNIR